jgi:hypothetical protein
VDSILGILNVQRDARGQHAALCALRANPALEPTAASALRLLAVPSSLRSSAAAQRERWAPL